jgi:hypothetical protein
MSGSGAVHPAEGRNRSGHTNGKVGPAGTDADGTDGRRRHGMLQKDTHLVFEHFFLIFGGNSVLEHYKHCIIKRIALFRQFA